MAGIGISPILACVLARAYNLSMPATCGMDAQEAVDAPRIHNQWRLDVTTVERFALSPDTRKILERIGHLFGPPQPDNHLAAILVGAPTLGGKPIGSY
jgi:gamma-glutamyltranspeptidase/glutathione hydrolase